MFLSTDASEGLRGGESDIPICSVWLRVNMAADNLTDCWVLRRRNLAVVVYALHIAVPRYLHDLCWRDVLFRQFLHQIFPG